MKALDRRIDELKSERERVLSEITVANPRYAFLAPSKPLGTVEIQHLLDPETLLLEYSLNNTGSFAFAITSSNVEFYSLPASDVISRLVQHVYTGISTRPQHRLRNVNEDSAALSKVILGPVASLLRRYKRIVIAGEKALDYVAFASLPSPDPTADEPFLMSRHEILEVPSVSFLAMIRRSNSWRRTGQFNRVAIIADPVYAMDDPRVRRDPKAIPRRGDETSRARNAELSPSLEDEARDRQAVWSNLPRLVYSRAEAAAIVKAVGQGQSFTALDFSANRTVASGPQVLRSRMIHYATHAFFDAQQPDFTGLISPPSTSGPNPDRAFGGRMRYSTRRSMRSWLC